MNLYLALFRPHLLFVTSVLVKEIQNVGRASSGVKQLFM